MSHKHKIHLIVGDTEKPAPNIEAPQRNAYRQGKVGQTIYLPLEANTDLRAMICGRMEDGARRVSVADLLREAVDNLLEMHGHSRSCGTPRTDTFDRLMKGEGGE